MDKELAKEIKELNRRLDELEKMLLILTQPLRDASKTAGNYLRLVGLLLEHGGLTPDVLIPEITDSISQEIIRVLTKKPGQNISQITELVRSNRGTASRRIIRKKLQSLLDKNIVQKKQKGAMYVYSLSDEVINKWSHLLGFTK